MLERFLDLIIILWTVSLHIRLSWKVKDESQLTVTVEAHGCASSLCLVVLSHASASLFCCCSAAVGDVEQLFPLQNNVEKRDETLDGEALMDSLATRDLGGRISWISHPPKKLEILGKNSFVDFQQTKVSACTTEELEGVFIRLHELPPLW